MRRLHPLTILCSENIGRRAVLRPTRSDENASTRDDGKHISVHDRSTAVMVPMILRLRRFDVGVVSRCIISLAVAL